MTQCQYFYPQEDWCRDVFYLWRLGDCAYWKIQMYDFNCTEDHTTDPWNSRTCEPRNRIVMLLLKFAETQKGLANGASKARVSGWRSLPQAWFEWRNWSSILQMTHLRRLCWDTFPISDDWWHLLGWSAADISLQDLSVEHLPMLQWLRQP